MRSRSTKLEKGRQPTVNKTVKPIFCTFIAGLISIGCTTVPETQDARQAGASGVQTESTANSRVWLNTRNGVYYCSGTRWYGNTYNSYFLDEKRARAAGYHPEHGDRCSEPVRVTAYQNDNAPNTADPLLLGNWSGEVYEIKGFPSKMGLRIDTRRSTGYSGYASVIGATKNPTSLPNCRNADIMLESFTGDYYHITFDGEGCDGKGKLRYKENRLSGQARINATQIFIRLVKEG